MARDSAKDIALGDGNLDLAGFPTAPRSGSWMTSSSNWARAYVAATGARDSDKDIDSWHWYLGLEGFPMAPRSGSPRGGALTMTLRLLTWRATKADSLVRI